MRELVLSVRVPRTRVPVSMVFSGGVAVAEALSMVLYFRRKYPGCVCTLRTVPVVSSYADFPAPLVNGIVK